MNDMVFFYDGELVNVRVILTNVNATCDFYTVMVFGTDDDGNTYHVTTIEHGFYDYTRKEIIGRMFYLAEQTFPISEWCYFGYPEWFEEWQQLTSKLMNYPK